jgi:zinc protease
MNFKIKNLMTRAWCALVLLSVLGSGSLALAETPIFFERDPNLPLVYVTVAVQGGATQDPSGKSGISDLVTKLLLRGTRLKSKQQINLILDQLGANLAVETRAEFVALRGNVLAENIQPFLNLIEEILSKPAFPQSEFDKLKLEQISNISDELSSDRNLVKLRFDQLFFGNHPYSRPNHGKIQDIQKLSLNDATQQYQRLFHPDRMMVLASGDASQGVFSDFVGQLRKTDWKSGPLLSLPQFTATPKKLRVVIVDKPELTQTHVMIGQKGVPFTSADVDALQLANFAFGGGSFQARLFAELRVKRGWTYGAGSGFKFGTQPHSWRMMFFPKNADTPPAIRESLKMVAELRDQGITAAEFEFAQQSMINGAGFAYNTPAKRMENRLIEKFFGLPDGYTRDQAKRLALLNVEQVNQALKRFLVPDNMLVTVVATASVSKSAIAAAVGIPEAQVEVVNFKAE